MKNIFYDVHILYDALYGILKHCQELIPNEAIGFLIGHRYRWMNKDYVMIIDYLPTDSISTRYSVKIKEGGIAPYFKKLLKKYNDFQIVGWYHSHPGYGVFMSEVDVKSHKTYFREPYHVALVVDPIRMEYQFFKVGEFGYYPVPHRVWKKRESLWKRVLRKIFV